MPLELTLACGDYDRTRALRDGRVVPDGIDLLYLGFRPEDIFYRLLRFGEFEAAEMSLGHLMLMVSRGEDQWVGIPVFPSRYFRHRSVWVNVESGIERPEDLKGKRVGCMDYYMTATLWIRGFLEDDYGVAPEDMVWYQGGQNSPGRLPFLETPPPSTLEVNAIPPDRTLSDMLAAGDIDALMSGYDPTCFTERHPAVRRLFPDFGEVERDYYARTGNFPIMHCVVVRRELYERHPWIALSLYKAFARAKAVAVAELEESQFLPVTLPWLHEHVEQARGVLGDDFWPYGLEANRHDLSTLIGYARRQGLLAGELEPEDLFAPNTLADPHI
jgi:4,5-dihydroxyphthalate decarboxylase